jgi:kynureninase
MDLAAHYSRFRVGERLLLTGHSHQAWPDAGFEGQQRAWLDAAALVDDKWAAAEAQAEQVRRGFARLLGGDPASVALGVNTHELVTRWLSALPLARRPRLLTTDGEFHTIRRQLARLAEGGLPVDVVAARPAATLSARLAGAVDGRTAGVLVSSVLFDTAECVPDLRLAAAACEQHGAALLVDAYHHLNVLPFDLTAMGLERAFVTGGGYKYCQLGEGNAFLRVPPGENLRPVVTGWFAEFADLPRAGAGRVAYGPGAEAFKGATYDPTSHYRAAAVFAFHERERLTADRLYAINRQQLRLLTAHVEALDIDPAVAAIEPMPADRRGGFLAIRMPRAPAAVTALRERDVFVDARGDVLRLGPAPYLRDDQLRGAVAALGEFLKP